ncbi:MAG: Ig domain-containing protein [Leptospira sp.]|nr:Ig domain-containing protein [Leptospira sp.]
MRPFLFLLILSIHFQACNFAKGKLDLASLALLFSRSGTSEISGIAMKGRVMGARVQVLPLVNNACDRTGATSPYAETTTDEEGNYAVRYPKDGKPVCVLVTPSANGRTVMFDETLKGDIAWTENNFYLDSIVQEPSGPTQKGVVSSPFSRMAARVFAKTMEKADPSFANAVANASSRQVVAMFGLNTGLVRSDSNSRSVKNRSANAHPRSFGRRANPRASASGSRSNNASASMIRNAASPVTPTLEDLNLDFTKPDDPFVATALIKLSGISALANRFAESASKSAQQEVTTRSTANGSALEEVIDGFSEVVASGGRRNTILTRVITQATGKAPPANFSRNPLEATMQTGITSFVQNSGGAAQFGISASQVETLFTMSSTPPTNLIVDTGSAPDYLYYADNNDEGALVLFTNTVESYFPWVEGGLPTKYEIRSGTLPPGMSLNSVTGEISGTPTSATAPTQITIRASNLFGATITVFRIRVQNFVQGQVFAFVYLSNCTQNTTCNLGIGIEGIRNSNYTITGFTSVAGTFSLTNGILGTFSGTALNVSGSRAGTLSYTDLNTGATGTISNVGFVIDSNVPTATVWASELKVGLQTSYVSFALDGVGDFGTYSFVPQNFGNGMSIDRFGSISGTPTVAGTWSPTISVIIANGQTVSVSLGNLAIASASGALNSLYVADSSNNKIYIFNTGSSGDLTAAGDIVTTPVVTSPYFFLWNGKHLVINGGSVFRSYFRNLDGSLTSAQSYTAITQPVFAAGNTAFNSTGKFFIYAVNTAASLRSYSKLQMDTNGSFFGEVNYPVPAGQNWTVIGPIHPIGNYFVTFHNSSTFTRLFFSITDLNTGAIGTATGDNSIAETVVYPGNGHCIYSLNADYLYCANIANIPASNGRIAQMSVTATAHTLLNPASVLVQGNANWESPKSIVLHPSGDYIFAYGNTNIYSYSVDQSTGIINPTPISVVPTPGTCPTNQGQTRLAIHSNGNMLYAACVNPTSSNNIGAYPISSAGALSAPTLTLIPGTTSNLNLFFVPGD